MCAIRVTAGGQDPKFQWSAGAGSQKSVVRSEVIAQLRSALDDPTTFPAIFKKRPAVVDLSLSGNRWGSDDLGKLLALFEQAAKNANKPMTGAIGKLRASVTWRVPNEALLDMQQSELVQAAEQVERIGQVIDDQNSVSSRLRKLSHRIVPQISEADLTILSSILCDAQESPPDDKAEFVRHVNIILDVFSLRIRAADGQLGRLSLGVRGNLQVTRPGGGNRGFKNTSIHLVSVDRIRVGNRFTAPDQYPDRSLDR